MEPTKNPISSIGPIPRLLVWLVSNLARPPMVGSFLHSGRVLGAAADRGECLTADEAASGTNEHPVHPEHHAGPTIGGLAHYSGT